MTENFNFLTWKRITLTLISLMATILYMVSVATSHWREQEHSPKNVIVTGLWQKCNDMPEAENVECLVGENSITMERWIKVCRGGAVVSITTSIIALVFSVVKFRHITNYIICVMHFISAISLAVTLVVYAIKFDDQKKHELTGKVKRVNYKLGWSYMIGWISIFCSMCCVVFILTFFQRKKKKNPLIKELSIFESL